MSDTTNPTHEPIDEFETLGRRAGAELRNTPPPGALDQVSRSAANHRRRLAGAAIVGVAALVAVVAVFAARRDDAPVAATTDAVIAYQEDLGGRIEIFRVRMNGDDRRSLGADVPGGNQVNPDWSPDGSRVVFGAANGTREDVWLVDADGSDPELLVPCTDTCLALLEPVWSPDGRQVMFSRLDVVDGVGRGTLETIDMSTREITVVATAEPGTFFAGQRWAPTGDRVVLEVVTASAADFSDEPSDVLLHVLDLTTSPPTSTPITEAGFWTVTADWSPDGTTIVYAARPTIDSTRTDLFLAAPDGTNTRRLTTLTADGGEGAEPTFSPDGSVVVFVASLDGQEGVLAQVPVTGGEITPAGNDSFRRGNHPDLTPA
jgi:dipeptidyl aminopeptidase/acylaminoacyl peptidase